MQDSFFSTDELATERALLLLTQFNNSGISSLAKRLNKGEQWNGGPTGKFLLEPHIDNFEKFNSNSGWVSSRYSDSINVLQALSHFSYHVSGGQFTLCDLQGGI